MNELDRIEKMVHEIAEAKVDVIIPLLRKFGIAHTNMAFDPVPENDPTVAYRFSVSRRRNDVLVEPVLNYGSEIETP